jgi:hypothetical protein
MLPILEPMERLDLEGRSFVAGFLAALALTGGALLTVGAVRRVSGNGRWVRKSQRWETEEMPVIDGARPLDAAIQGARPQEEANEPVRPLVSEAVDVPPLSQRW